MSNDVEVEIKVPKPHSEIQRKIINFFAMDGVDELWVSCGTKFGKTLSCSGALSNYMPLYPGTQWRWVAPYYSQAVIGYDLCRKILPSLYTEPNKTEMNLRLVPTDTNLKFVHGQKPEGLEGHAIHGYILDECAKMKEDVYFSARTTVTQTRSAGFGKFICASTPLGHNFFWRKCMEAREEEMRAKSEDRTPKMMFLTAPTSANPFIAQSVIEDAKRQLPDRLFRQYYLAEFVDESEVFRNYSNCLFGEEIDIGSGAFHEITEKDAGEKSVVIGADWARSASGDYTVFIAIDYESNPPKVIGFQRSRGLSFTEQIRNLLKFCNKFGSVSKLLHDKTGVGIAIDDQLAMTSLPFRGITFTNATKAELVTKLITSFEQRKLVMPNVKQIIHEIEVYEMSVSPLGAMVFNAAPGNHDDIVTALMLANEAALQYSDSFSNISYINQIPKSSIEGYYDSLIEDQEDSDFIEEIKPIGEVV